MNEVKKACESVFPRLDSLFDPVPVRPESFLIVTLTAAQSLSRTSTAQQYQYGSRAEGLYEKEAMGVRGYQHTAQRSALTIAYFLS
jgi:hypothetical protein